MIEIGNFVKLNFNERLWMAEGPEIITKVLNVEKTSFTFIHLGRSQIRPKQVILQVYTEQTHPEMFL